MINESAEQSKDDKSSQLHSTVVASIPELILFIFTKLPLKDLKRAQEVNQPFHQCSTSFFNITKLGPLPLSIWIKNILPYLHYKYLKNFQRVSRKAKDLMMSNADSLFSST